MKRITMCKKYKEFASLGGSEILEQTIYHFPNEFGASVIHGTGSYGMEAIKIHFDENGYALVGNSLGWLSDDELEGFLDYVKAAIPVKEDKNEN